MVNLLGDIPSGVGGGNFPTKWQSFRGTLRTLQLLKGQSVSGFVKLYMHLCTLCMCATSMGNKVFQINNACYIYY